MNSKIEQQKSEYELYNNTLNVITGKIAEL